MGNSFSQSPYIKFTPDGGFAVRLINKTGGASVKGTIAHPYASADRSFDLCPDNEPDQIGIVYGDDDGNAVAEAVPSSPFATDKHFQEIGHVLETTGGAGLALCLLHSN
jgi:hypothetical protein